MKLYRPWDTLELTPDEFRKYMRDANVELRRMQIDSANILHRKWLSNIGERLELYVTREDGFGMWHSVGGDSVVSDPQAYSQFLDELGCEKNWLGMYKIDSVKGKEVFNFFNLLGRTCQEFEHGLVLPKELEALRYP